LLEQEVFIGRLTCPEIGLHKSVKIWKDIQEKAIQNGNLFIQKNLKDLSAKQHLIRSTKFH
jgi:hypothetical protein